MQASRHAVAELREELLGQLRLGQPGGRVDREQLVEVGGREIQAVDAPHYEKNSGFYEFEQLDGKRTRINKDQVRSISDL